MERKPHGALAELEACSFLLKEGYEVFRNASAHGPIDIVAFDTKTRETLLIEVNTLNTHINEAGEECVYNKLLRSEQQEKLGVRLLGYVRESGRCIWCE